MELLKPKLPCSLKSAATTQCCRHGSNLLYLGRLTSSVGWRITGGKAIPSSLDLGWHPVEERSRQRGESTIGGRSVYGLNRPRLEECDWMNSMALVRTKPDLNDG